MAILNAAVRNFYKLLTGRRTIGQIFNLIKHKMCNFHGEVVNYQPPRLGICASFACNLHCDMCLTHSRKIPDNPFKYQGAREMDFVTFKAIIKKFPRSLIISFTGNGEPLLCKDLFKMINYAYYIGKMDVSLCTNGILLDEFIKNIISSSIADINVSINACNAKEYKLITGQSETIFEKIVNNIKLLIAQRNFYKSKIRVLLSFIITKHNYTQTPQIIDFSSVLGVDCIGLYNIIPSDAPGLRVEDVCLTNDREIIDYLKSLQSPSNKIKIYLPTVLDSNPNNRLCRDFYSSISIDGDGNIGGCERILLNTSNNGKFWESNVFNNKHIRTMRRIFNSKNSMPLYKPCQACYNNTTLVFGELK